jgi:hypothetical protein
MCYSASVSFTTFFFVVCISIVVWIRNKGTDRAIALILIVVAFMQLIEGVIWLHHECDIIKQYFSASIPIILYIQPLLINAIVAWYAAGSSSGYGIIAVLFLIFLPFQLFRAYQDFGRCVTTNTNGQLDWTPLLGNMDPIHILPRLIYDGAMIFPFLTFKNHVFGLSYIGLSIVLKVIFEGKFTQTWPSLWCHFVNGLAVLALLQ